WPMAAWPRASMVTTLSSPPTWAGAVTCRIVRGEVEFVKPGVVGVSYYRSGAAEPAAPPTPGGTAHALVPRCGSIGPYRRACRRSTPVRFSKREDDIPRPYDTRSGHTSDRKPAD